MNVKKYFLNEVIRLSWIAKNSLANVPDGTSITSEEQSKGITVSGLDA